ncbi:MAG: translation initiation factor IF-2, partial [Elusimicrobia bacterium RIFCSPLOWO2_01_FULL_60_11]
DLLMKLLKMGTRASLNQRLDVDTCTLLAAELGFEAVFTPIYSEDAMMKTDSEEDSALLPRPPIVTIMGHVDHGKTSLLDAIREARVAEGEAGGITQHIGAYKVAIEKGSIVFLDTPGHEAFTAMRARGAQVTDIVVLVVAADDGVMPQTVEAIDHARAAGVPIIVAVNKIDLPQAKPERVKQELSNYQLSPEEWGGKTIFVEVSAKKRMNIDKLLEMILLQAEILELKANPDRPAQCVVIEARLDPKKGPVATVLVQKGTLRVGSTFVSGLTSGKVRAMLDERGQRVNEAGPSTPVEVLGFSAPPHVGERVLAVNSEKEAREISERRKDLSREASMEKKRHISLEMLSAIATQGKIKVLNIVLKTDVQGSLQALKDSIEKIAHNEIRCRVIHSGVGGVNESDVSLAAASDAVIIGFNVRPEPAAEEIAKREGVEIKTYRIIYEVIQVIEKAMEGLLEPEEKEVALGRVEIREVFKTPQGKVGGCMVVKGKASRTAKVRILRDSKIIYEGSVASLRRFKDDVKEVEQGYDCGISFEGYQDFNKGDVVEVFVREKQARKLE